MLDGFRIRLRRVRSRTFLKQTEDLVNLRGEEVEGGEDAAVGAEVVLLHDFFVVDGVTDVDIAVEGDVADGGVEVDYVGRCTFGVEVGVDALHEGGLA